MPQYLLTGIADNRAESGNGIAGVEVEYAQKVLMLKVVAGVQSAAGHERVGGTDSCRVLERHPYVVIIILWMIEADQRKSSAPCKGPSAERNAPPWAVYSCALI